MDLVKFKTSLCNENKIITNIFKNELTGFFIEPILDVGSGLGDITSKALPNKKVIHIDVDDYSDYKLPLKHERELINFFDFSPKEKINTLLFSHTLQYVDSNIEGLNKKLGQLNPEIIVTVANTNEDFMGDLISWFNKNIKDTNPEVEITNFPVGYSLVKKIPFTATVQAANFSDLAEQVSAILFDVKLERKTRDKIINYLKQKLQIPVFSIDQEIKIYTKMRSVTAQLPTKFGLFNIRVWPAEKGLEPISLTTQDLDLTKPVLVRIHSECVTGDALGSRRCDCGAQKNQALKLIAQSGNGVFMYLRQEGRGIGLFELDHSDPACWSVTA